jgi:hypothetical protein
MSIQGLVAVPERPWPSRFGRPLGLDVKKGLRLVS